MLCELAHIARAHDASERFTMRRTAALGRRNILMAFDHRRHIDNSCLRNQMATAKKAPAKKAANETASGEAKAPTKKTAPSKKSAAGKGFMKEMKVSPALAAVIGDKPMPRTEVTKKIWEYIKKNNLQDEKQKRVINADDKLREIFKKPQVDMFEMTKLISAHLS